MGHEGPTLALRLDELGEENIHKQNEKKKQIDKRKSVE
jgi:hypothetical protein